MSRLRTLCVLLVGALSGALATAICLRGTPSAQKNSAHDVGQPAQVISIPLGSIFCTSGQEGLEQLSRGQGDSYRRDLEKIYVDSGWLGASIVFLARAKDVQEAVSATRSVFLGGRSADEVVESPDKPQKVEVIDPHKKPKKVDSFWLVVYFGRGTINPLAWSVKSVEISGQTIRLSYSRPPRGAYFAAVTGDQYFAWVPLGQLQPGTYKLELFDADVNEPNLTRRVIVAPK